MLKNMGPPKVQKNTITINGKTYDASSGALIIGDHTSKSDKKPVVHSPKTTITKPGNTLDIIHPLPSSSRQKAGPAHFVHKKTQSTTTLRRDIVKKPTHAQGAQSTIIKDTPTQIDTIHSVSADRIIRSNATTKSNVISRFGASNVHTITHKHLPVAQAPSSIQSTSISTDEEPEHSKSEKMFAHAIAGATHHQSTPHKHKAHRALADKLKISPRMLSVGSTAFAVLLLVGFFAFQNIPQVAYKVAAKNAGVSGQLPSNNISGYSMSGPITYSPGQLTISFKSTSDERSYKIEQRSSSWNSEALKANYLSLKNETYQSIESKGRTVFTYGQGNATWVDGGVWYRIEGNDRLSTSQLLAIANGL